MSPALTPPRRSGIVAASAALAAAAVLLGGCAGPVEPAGSDGAGVDGAAHEDVLWFAPSSFTDVAEPLAEAYEAYAAELGRNAEVTVNLGSSAQLVQQVNAGAAPDVLVTADEAAPKGLERPEDYAPPAGERGVLVSNRLVLIRPAAAEEADAAAESGAAAAELPAPGALADSDVALCAPEVPCGRAAHAWLAAHPDYAEVLDDGAASVSQEANVRAVLAKVVAGQADVGFVYATDAAAAGDSVAAFPLDAEPNRYPVLAARAPEGGERGPGGDFATWLLGEAAQRILADAGFTPGTEIDQGSPEPAGNSTQNAEGHRDG